MGYTVADTDDSDHAAPLARRTALAEGIHGLHDKPVFHGDNGATLKATTVLAMLHWRGVKPSYSRPRVSDDNAFVESLFRTAKYRFVPDPLSRGGVLSAAGEPLLAPSLVDGDGYGIGEVQAPVIGTHGQSQSMLGGLRL